MEKQYRVSYARGGKIVTTALVTMSFDCQTIEKDCALPFAALFEQALLPEHIKLWLLVGTLSQPRQALVQPTKTLGEQIQQFGGIGQLVQFQWQDPNDHPLTIYYKASMFDAKIYQLLVISKLRVDLGLIQFLKKINRPLSNESKAVKFEVMFVGQKEFTTIEPSERENTVFSKIDSVKLSDTRIEGDRCPFLINIGGLEATIISKTQVSLEYLYQSLLIATTFIAPPPCQASQYGKALNSATLLHKIDPLEPLYFHGDFCHCQVSVKTPRGPITIRKPVPASWNLNQVIDQLFFDPINMGIAAMQDPANIFPGYLHLSVSDIDWSVWQLTSHSVYEPVFFDHPNYSIELLVNNREKAEQYLETKIQEYDGRLHVTVPPETTVCFSQRIDMEAAEQIEFNLDGFFQLPETT